MSDDDKRPCGARELPIELLIEHALFSEAYAARMYGDNPELHPDAVKAYRWAEKHVRPHRQQGGGRT